ncbi:MAG: hypothetical protein ABIP97_02460 [Chthoniobacterales bacterium]
MKNTLDYFLVIPVIGSIPLALWLAYRLGCKAMDFKWREAITWTDHPEEIARMVAKGRRRMEADDTSREEYYYDYLPSVWASKWIAAAVITSLAIALAAYLFTTC